FGALGVLDDVTVTQAATVEQLHRAEPGADRRGVIGRAMRVGRSHIAATVNTLMLAYLGAGLPLLLLFALGGQSPLLVLNGEIVAVEVIRALVGSVGIVAAVPLTTLVAAALMVPGRHGADAA
ncbi:MAG: YibE/F family protein, partial [Candidatus Limnocylindria bacterium]